MALHTTEVDRYGGYNGVALLEKKVEVLQKSLSDRREPIREKFRADFILAQISKADPLHLPRIFEQLREAEAVVFPDVG